jgi:HK97 family phage portal protein
MAWLDWLRTPKNRASGAGGARAAFEALDLNDPLIAEFLRNGELANSGATVNRDSAMRVAAVYACVRIIAGAVSSMPLKLYTQQDRTRVEASDHPINRLIAHKPNEWQTSKRWRHLMQSHMLLDGNGYSLIAGGRRRPLALYPLDPKRMQVEQKADLSLSYRYEKKNGHSVTFDQDEILHLRGMSLDGITGLSPVAYAREAIGLAIQGERHGASLHKNGMQVGSVLKFPNGLSDAAYKRLKDGLEQFRGTANAHKNLILEEGGDFAATMSNVDAQWLENRKFQRGDIFMFYGVPPHMAGDTEKSTSWGTGLEQQSQGFVSYTLDDWLTEWEQSLAAALVTDDTQYFKFTRASLVRGDIKTRYGAYAVGLTNGFLTPNECRAMEELPPMDGGDTLRVPLNTAPITDAKETEDEPATPA